MFGISFHELDDFFFCVPIDTGVLSTYKVVFVFIFFIYVFYFLEEHTASFCHDQFVCLTTRRPLWKFCKECEGVGKGEQRREGKDGNRCFLFYVSWFFELGCPLSQTFLVCEGTCDAPSMAFAFVARASNVLILTHVDDRLFYLQGCPGYAPCLSRSAGRFYTTSTVMTERLQAVD